MKTLSDVAASYEEQAKANEILAEEILARAHFFPAEVRENQRWRAGWLMAEAARLRARAAELRRIESCQSMN